MFKLESYITPIILNYVAKYVKNIRPQDSQVSLWEGEVAFQNLDLRLDVLEEELQLPFEFLSGHIHELSIHVPWTKINSEPINITINTIEFVLKLKDQSAQPTQERKKRASRVEDIQQGYIPGLVNKIINNIAINCHNIILKYVEDDIVVSMNIQLLSMSSADENWQKCFAELNPMKVVLRKLIQVSDLTICLDKRNEMGQIEVCQEPILYKCSLEIRILRKYNAATAATASTTIVHLFSKSMDINVSSVQFPMVMRLLALVLALKSGELKSMSSTEVLNETPEDSEGIVGTAEPDAEETESSEGHFLNFASYVESLKFTLKSSEFITETIVQATKKIRYNPIMQINLKGIFSETVMSDSKWFNTKAGVASIHVKPLCNYCEDEECHFLTTSTVWNNSYLNESLFDKNSKENTGKPYKYIRDVATYLVENTINVLQYRGTAMAFEMVHTPEEKPLEGESKGTAEYLLIRASFSMAKLCVNSSLLLVIDAVKELVASYNYPPYVEEKQNESVPAKLPPPSMDEYDDLMSSDIPKKQIQVVFTKISVNMHPRVIPERKEKTKLISSFRKKRLPWIELRISKMDAQWTTPLHPNTLVFTTCQLPTKPQELLDSCYDLYTLNLERVLFHITDTEAAQCILTIPAARAVFGAIIQPDLWTSQDDIKYKLDAEIDSIIASYTRPQYITAVYLMKTMTVYDYDTLMDLSGSACRAAIHGNFPKIEHSLNILNLSARKYIKVTCCWGWLRFVQSCFISNERGTKCFTFKAPPEIPLTHTGSFCHWNFQVPNDFSDENLHTVVALRLANFFVIIEPELEEYLSYENIIMAETEGNSIMDASQKVEKQRTPRTSVQTDRSRKVANPEETIHLSSEKEEKIEVKSTKSTLSNKESTSLPNLLHLKNVVVNVQIDHGSVFIPAEGNFLFYADENMDEESDIDYALITLPSIKIKSSIAEDIEVLLKKTFPQEINMNSARDTFPWMCDLINFNISTNMLGMERLLLSPIKTSITAALTHKKLDPKHPGTLAFNIHIDTAPIHAVLPEVEGIFFFTRFRVLQKLIAIWTKQKRVRTIFPGDRVRIVLHDEDDRSIKDFLAMQSEPPSSNSLEKVIQENVDDPDIPLSVSFWLQWTVAKLRLDIIALVVPTSKLTFELEDFITSIDKQVEYFKLKNKIGTLSANYFEASVGEKWKPNDSIKLLVNTEGSKAGETFFDLTITQAETMNVFNKLGTQKNAYNLHKSITEIVANIQAINLLLDIDRLSRFAPIVCGLQPEISVDSSRDDPYSVADLPLIYLQSKGVTLYMPLVLNGLANVCIFKVGGIKISPNVDNPLTRITVRQDIYNKAAQLRMLHTPGSKVEDRQYEMIFSDISAATGQWLEVLSFLNKDTTGTFHNKNPAVEWNNQTEENLPTLELVKMFSNFIVSVTYAPCIVYEKILVSGQALEFNCLTDLVVSLTDDQLVIIAKLLSRLESIHNLVCKEVEVQKFVVKVDSSNAVVGKVARKSVDDSDDSATLQPKMTHFTSYKDILIMSNIRRGIKTTYVADVPDFDYDTGQYPDSGVAMSSSLPRKTDADYMPEARRQNEMGKERKIPSEVSFVAGVFIFKFFFSYKKKIPGVRMSTKISEPLLTCTVNQPSMMFAQKLYASFHQFSVYDINVTLKFDDNPEDKSARNEYVFFKTRPRPVTTTGITPPLLWVKVIRNTYNSLELDCNLLRPIVLDISHPLLKKFCMVLLIIEQAFMGLYKPPQEKNVPITRGKKIHRIRKMLFDANRINVMMQKIKIQAVDNHKYNLILTASNLHLRVKFSDRPEMFKSSLSAEAISIFLSGESMLHPSNFASRLTITQETWQTIPVVVGKIDFNVVHMDIGPEDLIRGAEAWQHLEGVLNDYHQERVKILSNTAKPDAGSEPAELEEYVLPKVESRERPPKVKEEYYQDDLRAGAFQFIVCDNDNELPMSYQIQIILKNNGIICWRYPQPRRVTKLRILPIPMESKKPIEILCRMEYYNEASQSYQHFCEFNVSETETNSVDIPKRTITANIWRVVILQSLIIVNGQYFECACSSDEDDDNMSTEISIDDALNTPKTERDFRLNPKSLVACMRVDTTFHPAIAPTIQAVVKFNLIQLNLQNQYERCTIELPTLLHRYDIAGKSQDNHTFATLTLSNLELYGAKLGGGEYVADLDMTVSCKILDYSYLNMLYFLEESNVKIQLNYCKQLILNSTIDALKINMGPSMLHTIEASTKHWDRVVQKKYDKHPILTRYLVVNRTNLNLMFGQVDTKEKITLKPLEISLYSFRSDYSDQKLVFGLFVDERVFIRSDGISVDDEKVQYVRIAEYVLIVRTKKLSKLQISVIIRGQIDLVSMVDEELRVHLKISGKSETSSDNSIVLPGKAKMGFCAKLMRETDMTIRLKFRGTANKGWSGEVPLRANKSLPWLVKVPKIGSDTYLSYWLRVIREDIPEVATNNFVPQRVLVIIWPMFVLHSMLTTPVAVTEATTSTSFTLPGHGDRINLSIPGNHETEHRLTIQKSFVSPHGEDKTTAKLTFKTIDWNKFFWFDEKYWTAEKAFDELGKEFEIHWPSSNEEELQLKRSVPEHEKTTPIYRCLPSQDFSCALMLDISAWALFINSLGMRVEICESSENSDSLVLESNFISILFMVKEAFTLRIPHGSGWASSDPIYIFNVPKGDRAEFQGYYLDEVGSLTVTLRYGKHVSELLLTSTMENGYRLFTVAPLYIIANFSSHPLKAFCFCMAEGEDIKKLEVETKSQEQFVVVPTVKKDLYKGITLDSFQDLYVGRKPRSRSTAYTFFVCLKIQTITPISLPFVLNKVFNRKCFSLQMGSESVALAASVVEHKGQYFLSIYNDPFPAVDISNETNLMFYVGQPESLDPLRATRVIKETENDFSGWYQILPAKSQLYYSPPDMYTSFPDIETHFGKLTFALVNDANTDSEDDIKWSKPIRTDMCTEKYFNVPLHGDVKLTVCDKHTTARVCLFYSKQKTEFCVKDLRSRLTNIGLDDNDLLFPREPSSDDDLSLRRISDASVFSQSLFLTDSNTHATIVEKRDTKLKSCSHLEVNKIISDLKIDCNVFVKEMNLNFFMDSKEKSCMKTEIVSVYVDDFIIQFDADTRNYDIIVSNLQIDNQLFSTGNYDFPVILCPEQLYKRIPVLPLPHNLPDEIQKCYKENPLIFIRAKLYDEENHIESFYINMKPIRAYIEDTYMHDLYNQLHDCLPQNMVTAVNIKKDRISLSSGEVLLPRDVVNQVVKLSEIVRIRTVRIEHISVLISVHTSVSIYIAVDHSPLQFSSYEKKDIITLTEKLEHAVEMHYLSEFLFGAGWVVGSLEILGSPSGLARSLSIGLRDFVSLPVQGLLRGPWGFVVGMTQGSASLLRNITAGTVNSLTKLASSLARNLDRLTLDEEHLQRTEALRRCRPQGFAEGFSQGLTGLGISLLGAVGGLARHPLEAKSSVQVVTGVGKGIVGAFAKPISGAAELLALTGQGMLHTVGFNTMPKQRFSTVTKNTTVHLAECKIAKLLPNGLSSDPVLFFQEATLVLGDQLKRAIICMTNSVFTVIDVEKDEITEIIPIEKIEATFDSTDSTLIHLHVNLSFEDNGEDMNFTNQRIMSFLKSSETSMSNFSASLFTLESTIGIRKKKLDCSFYMSAHLGQHLLNYLKTIKIT